MTLQLRVTSGELCDVEVLRHGGKTAVKVLWHSDTDLISERDQQEVELTMNLLLGNLSGQSTRRNFGNAPEDLIDRAAARFLKSDDN